MFSYIFLFSQKEDFRLGVRAVQKDLQMDRRTRIRSCRELTYTGALCGLIIVVACQIVLCSGQATFGPDHMLFDIDNLPERPPNSRSEDPPSRPPTRHHSSGEESGRKPLYKKPGGHSRYPSSEEKARHPSRRPEGHLVEGHPRRPSSEEEIARRTETHEVDSHENFIDSRKHQEGGGSNEDKHSSEASSHIEEDKKTGTKTFDTKTFLNGVSILTGEPDPEYCEILDAWACNAEQTKAVCPNRCANIAQAVDAPWCKKDKQEALCNHHDARWMCPSFCAAIDASDCNLFEDWVCKAEKAKKICPERCNNVNFTTDAPWCAQHGDEAGCSWLCMNPDANQMCSFFCLLHGFPLIGQNGRPTGIPPGLLNGISGMSELQGTYSGIENTPGTQYGNQGNVQQGMGSSQGIAGIGVYEHFMKLKNSQRIIGGIPGRSGGMIGSLQGAHAGPAESQGGYQGSQMGYPQSQTGYIGPQSGIQGIPIGYTGPQAEYSVSQTFSEAQPGYQGRAQTGYPESPMRYPGSYSGPSGGSDCSVGSVPGYPEASPCELQAGIQAAYPGEGVYGTGIQSSYGTGVGDAYDTGFGGTYGTGSGVINDVGYGDAYDTGSGGVYGTGAGEAYDAVPGGAYGTGSNGAYNVVAGGAYT